MKRSGLVAVTAAVLAWPTTASAQEPAIEWIFQKQSPSETETVSLQERWAAPFSVESSGRPVARAPRVVTVIREPGSRPLAVAPRTDAPASAGGAVTTPAPASSSASATAPERSATTPPTSASAPASASASTSTPTSTSETRRILHLVVRGETLTGIAQQYRVDPRAILQANRMDDDRVRTGQRLIIPGATVPAASVSEAAREDSATRPGAEPPASQPRRDRVLHQVKQGDTLLGIARQYGVTPLSIVEANLMDDEVVRVGQRLIIPPPPARR